MSLQTDNADHAVWHSSCFGTQKLTLSLISACTDCAHTVLVGLIILPRQPRPHAATGCPPFWICSLPIVGKCGGLIADN
jgi:hypothetical protein